MYLKTIFIRFYKSFNFDYLRKHHEHAQSDPWEKLDNLWYPYVRIPIDPKVTTVVGANESGKSHLLTAIEKGISGQDIEREDFCRYSQFFTVELGQMKWPDFGFEWAGFSEGDREYVRAACGLTKQTPFDRFLLFRTNRNMLSIYLPKGNGYSVYEVKEDHVASLIETLPQVFRINSNVALPESVPIKYLCGEGATASPNRFESLTRRDRSGYLTMLDSIDPSWVSSPEQFAQAAGQLFPTMSTFFKQLHQSATMEAQQRQEEEFALAYDLIRKVARIDPNALTDLSRALQLGREGHVNGIIQKINDALAVSLNFPHWWVQDRDFALMVSSRDYDLVFTIRDRTGTHYSFNERSSGLRYFLSYYIQYLAHEPQRPGPEILLMDEPDAYLSSQAQQDLLKIFEAFATPARGKAPVQVIYVTHSPFLIDKNHAERIRVLEKGVDDEGTRVVRDAAKNHYEPLRSAFGSFLGETTFIGNCNLMVEGIADQVLLAGAAAYLRSRGAPDLETLDLNQITIVPAGSASHIPYLVYLARGRDIERPAVIVLLDSDKAGNDAKKELLRGGPKRKMLLKEDFILQLGDLDRGAQLDQLTPASVCTEIEDLIPPALCAQAARAYLTEICGADTETATLITDTAIREALATGSSTFDAIQTCFANLLDGEWHIEKVGFARLVIEAVHELAAQPDSASQNGSSPLAKFESNLRLLFRQLRRMQRDAERELTGDRVSRRVDRAKNSFLRDHPEEAKREHALVLLEEIEAALDGSLESDEVLIGLQRLRRDFHLDVDVTEPIQEYSRFRDRLDSIKYLGRLVTQVPDDQIGI
jgi:predicted ATPase